MADDLTVNGHSCADLKDMAPNGFETTTRGTVFRDQVGATLADLDKVLDGLNPKTDSNVISVMEKDRDLLKAVVACEDVNRL